MDLNFGTKVKKRLRKIWHSNIFRCFCADQKNENSCDIENTNTTTATIENLQILLRQTLQSQVEDREFQVQLRNTLIYFTTVLEQFSKKVSIPEHYGSRSSNEKYSEFIISYSQNSLIHCKADVGSQSLMVLNRKDFGREFLNSTLSETFQKGRFGSYGLLYKNSNDKSVQFGLAFSGATTSKLIQTPFVNLTNFDVVGFKINLIRHMRSLKQDVVTLRQLLLSVEGYLPSSSLDIRSHLAMNKMNYYYGDEFEYKFFEAKARAANFVKFYKLRTVVDKNNKKNVRTRRKSLEDVVK